MQADELPPPAQMVLLLGGFRISQAFMRPPRWVSPISL